MHHVRRSHRRAQSRLVPLFAACSALLACPHYGDGGPVAPLPSVADAAVAADDGSSNAPARATHTGLVSVQQLAVEGLPGVGEGLTVQALFTPASAPAYEETPGAPTGCKAWSYTLPERPPPALQDHGALTLSGLAPADLTCGFAVGRGYDCEDGADADSELSTLKFLRRSYVPGMALRIALTAGGERGFASSDRTLTPGETFALDDASRAAVTQLPLDGRAVTLSCQGAGGTCNEAQATIVRITTTDASVAGLSAVAMPSALRRYVEISCASIGAASITLPAAAMELLREAHAASPLTRIRTAFMRDAVALVTNAPPEPPNRVVLAVGHARVGYTDPARAAP